MSFYKSLFNLSQVEADILRYPTGAAQGLFLVCADQDGTFSWQSIGNYAVTNLIGTTNRISITNNGNGSYTISTPQDINTTSTPTFNQIRLTASPVNNYFLRSDSSGNASWAPISSHAITDIFGTANQIIVTKNINNEATLSTPQNIDTSCNFQTASTTATNIMYSPVYQITDIPGAQWRLTFGNFNLNFFKQDATLPYNFPTTPLIWFSNGDTINSTNFYALTSNANNPKYSFQGHPNDGLYHSASGVLGLTNSIGQAYLDNTGDFNTTQDLKIANGKSLYIHNSQYTQADLDKITGITNGTASANKALVVDNQLRISNIDRITTNAASIANFITGTDFNQNSIFAVSQLSLENGTLINPSLYFYNHDCGVYSSANRHMNFISQGIDRFEISNTSNTSKQSLSISTGSLNTNSINTFSGNDINFNSKGLHSVDNIRCRQYSLNQGNDRSRIFEAGGNYYFDSDNTLIFRKIDPSTGNVNNTAMVINNNGITDILSAKLFGTLDMNNNIISNSGNITFSSTNPRINFGNSGFGQPTYNTISAGTKLIIWDGISSTYLPYSIGTGINNLWLATSQDAPGFSIKFYTGETERANVNTGGISVDGLQGLTSSTINFNNNTLTNITQANIGVGLFGSGSVTAPGMSFITNEGFYRPSKDNLALTLNGIQRVNFSTSQLNTSLNIIAPVLDLSNTLTVAGLSTFNGQCQFNNNVGFDIGTVIFNTVNTYNELNNFWDIVRLQSTSTLDIRGTLTSTATANLTLNNLLTINNTTTAGNLYLQNNNTNANTNLRLLHLQSNLTTQTPYMQINRNNTVSDLEMGVAGYNGALISDSLQGDTVIRSHGGRVIFGCGNRNIAEVRINNSNIGIPLWVDTGFGVNVNNFGYLNNGGGVGYYAGVPQNWAISLYTGQAIVCNAQIMVISDKRTKHDIKDIDEKVIEDFLKIDSKEFTKDGQFKPQYGFMAQDLAKVSHNFVNLFNKPGVAEHIDSDGFISPADNLFSVNYECIDAIQHMIIKKQQARIKQLENQVSNMQTQLNNIIEILNRNNII